MQETTVRFLGQEDPLEKGYVHYSWASLLAQLVKNLGGMGREMGGRFKREGGSKGRGYMYTCGSFMLKFNRK